MGYSQHSNSRVQEPKTLEQHSRNPQPPSPSQASFPEHGSNLFSKCLMLRRKSTWYKIVRVKAAHRSTVQYSRKNRFPGRRTTAPARTGREGQSDCPDRVPQFKEVRRGAGAHLNVGLDFGRGQKGRVQPTSASTTTVPCRPRGHPRCFCVLRTLNAPIDALIVPHVRLFPRATDGFWKKAGTPLRKQHLREIGAASPPFSAFPPVLFTALRPSYFAPPSGAEKKHPIKT